MVILFFERVVEKVFESFFFSKDFLLKDSSGIVEVCQDCKVLFVRVRFRRLSASCEPI